MGRKHFGKRRNSSLRAISPFPTMFSKGLFPRGVIVWEWVKQFFHIQGQITQDVTVRFDP